jgi:hypothetical protein
MPAGISGKKEEISERQNKYNKRGRMGSHGLN